MSVSILTKKLRYHLDLYLIPTTDTLGMLKEYFRMNYLLLRRSRNSIKCPPFNWIQLSNTWWSFTSFKESEIIIGNRRTVGLHNLHQYNVYSLDFTFLRMNKGVQECCFFPISTLNLVLPEWSPGYKISHVVWR